MYCYKYLFDYVYAYTASYLLLKRIIQIDVSLYEMCTV